MADLFALSSAVIDNGNTDHMDTPLNRITQELSELSDGMAVVESFSHSVLFSSDEGLVVFDTSGAGRGKPVVDSIRRWSKEPFHTVVYTHGHVDHVGGSGAFQADARDNGGTDPRFVGHERVRNRMQRYRDTSGYNMAVNRRQFKGFARQGYSIGAQNNDDKGTKPRQQHFLPIDAVFPNTTYTDQSNLRIGNLEVHMTHALGETDDHTWSWIPSHKAICSGDFFIWNFPNCGNPQKVQRYPLEWAKALRDMAARQPEFLLPAHGLPICGAERIQRVLDDVASVLENLVRDCLQMMNDGALLDDLLHSVRVPKDELAKPWMRPLYDEPEFAVRNIWRLYGGWYDGNPAHLKPAPQARLAAENAQLAGGADKLAARARELAQAGDFRTACHLVEDACLASPDDAELQVIRGEIYQQRRGQETSLMAKGIFGTAARESEERAAQLKKGS